MDLFCLCTRCGGMKYRIESGCLNTPASNDKVKVCLCPPKRKHDGYLDETGCHYVSLWSRIDDPRAYYVTLRYLQTDSVTHIHLSPGQALSLLSWLQQEEGLLRDIVKEEQG